MSGFPGNYSPGQAYTITVSRTGATNIANFNASVRVGTGTANGGVISAGTATSTYNVSGETNGVHFTTAQQSSGTFTWTAPAAGTGTVRLYLGGHQGTSSSGPNNAFVFVSDEAALPPPAPQAVVLLSDPPLARLYWPPVTGAAGYNIYRVLSYELPYTPGDLIGSTSDTAFVDSTVLSRLDVKAFYIVTATTP